MGPDDLILCSGTLRRGVPFAERVAAASAAGFVGVSLWGRDYAAARAGGLSDADMRAMLAAHGLEVAELDPAWWWLPGASEVHIPPGLDSEDVFRFGESDLFAMADVLGARSINAVDVFGGGWDVEAAAEAFAGLCRRAAEHDLLVHIEWLPWSKIPDLAQALEGHFDPHHAVLALASSELTKVLTSLSKALSRVDVPRLFQSPVVPMTVAPVSGV